MNNKTVARYVVGSSGLYKHSLYHVKAILIDENGCESEGGMLREFDSKKQAKAAAKLMNEGIVGGPKFGPGHGK